jgi:hypothetical protein
MALIPKSEKENFRLKKNLDKNIGFSDLSTEVFVL